MANCSNCYNGCSEIVSDKCVKYTGVDVPVLGIKNGDSLSYVEQALIEFLTSTLDGTGIKINVPEENLCDLISGYLPDCGELTTPVLFNALIKSACDLQNQVNNLNTRIDTIEADYDVDCLSGVSADSGTHAILQAVITKLCLVEDALTAFQVDVDTNYVKLADLNSLIQAYLDSIAPATEQYYTRMVPYSVVEYYGPLSNFDGSGKGLVANGFDKIYLCNGQNGTPDKRGRLPVGAIAGVPGGALSPIVAPGGFNPNYGIGDTFGANTVTVTSANQLPPHNHSASSVVTDPGHSHTYDKYTVGGASNVDGDDGPDDFYYNSVNTSSSTTGITVSTTIGTTGSSAPIQSIPPVLACYYIQYRP